MLKFSGSSCLIGGPNESGTVSAKRVFTPFSRSAGRGPAACARLASRESPPKRAPSTTLCGRAREASFTRLGALGAWELRNTQSPPRLPTLFTGEGEGASGVNRHSDKHAPRSIPEAQDAFKVLMIHWILQVARRIAFRCVLHRCGSQDIRR